MIGWLGYPMLMPPLTRVTSSLRWASANALTSSEEPEGLGGTRNFGGRLPNSFVRNLPVSD